MIKVYRKTATIKAERFDNSREMAEKYHVEYDGAYILPFRIETPNGWLGIKVGDWVATGVNGEHWPIDDDVFKKTYADLPVVPKDVADYIKHYKNPINLSFHSALYEAFDNLFSASRDVEHWINHNSDIFARAWLDGYVVEEEHD
ncbi:DUF1642 domain-containing protein [Lactiplantibacillus plantarum]|uniref:DUF1642 domain-containing protein n=1 Tax=Lactiplantibacillus plantarum TaxID=1590 RepID=UPI003D684203